MSSFNEESNTLNVEIDDVTPANIEQLKSININTLPGTYAASLSQPQGGGARGTESEGSGGGEIDDDWLLFLRDYVRCCC